MYMFYVCTYVCTFVFQSVFTKKNVFNMLILAVHMRVYSDILLLETLMGSQYYKQTKQIK